MKETLLQHKYSKGKIGVYLFKVNLGVHTLGYNILAASCIEGFQDIMLITFAVLVFRCCCFFLLLEIPDDHFLIELLFD